MTQILSYFSGKNPPLWQKAAVAFLAGLPGLARRAAQNMGVFRRPAQNIGAAYRQVTAHDAPASHCFGICAVAYESTVPLPKLIACGHGAAPSWGDAGNDHADPCTARGRQQEWYKDFWPLHLQRLWRWWLYRAAWTVRHYRLHRTRPAFRQAKSTAALTSHPCRGWAAGPIRSTSLIRGDV